MPGLRKKLIEKLSEISGVTVDHWKDSELLCVFYKGKEVAHFHGNNEIDIRLTRTIINQEGLKPPPNTKSHPNRSNKTKWIVQSFRRSEHVEEMVRLIKLAIKQL